MDFVQHMAAECNATGEMLVSVVNPIGPITYGILELGKPTDWVAKLVS